MSTYWSVEECAWVEHVPEAVIEAPEQRQPANDEQVVPVPV